MLLAQWQVIRDAKWTQAPAGADGSIARKLEWRRAVESYLSAETADDKSATPTKEAYDKLARVATFDLVNSLDKQFKNMIGEGLSRFLPQTNDPRPLHERPRLTLHWDTGSDNVCGSSDLLYRKNERDHYSGSTAQGVEMHVGRSKARRFVFLCVACEHHREY